MDVALRAASILKNLDFCITFKSFQAPIVVSIARSRHSESNGSGITSGKALEPEL